MSNQTEQYISLKPISEKFNNVSQAITEEDIKSVIIGELKDQLKGINFRTYIEEIIDNYVENNSDEINGLIKESIKKKFQ